MAAKPRRNINPKTRDYVQSAGGIEEDTAVGSQIILALATQRGSCQAYPTFGSRLHLVSKADDAGLRLATFYAQEALEHIKQRVKDLVVEAVSLGQGRIELRIGYRIGNEAKRVTYTRSAS